MKVVPDEQNYFELTSEFVQHTSQNIYLTGKAGTGKTTFLKHIKEHCEKNLVVVAPTGVAAINAGGVTAHSFFQLPLGLFVPGSFRGEINSDSAITDRHHLIRNLRLNTEKRDLMRNLELLIIDEVSMLRADMLDAIDVVLRTVRRNQRESFGGVQVLLIGDLYQLPPVVKENEWALLREYYQSPFFFEALVFKEATPLCIELMKVYRQSDEQFIHLLNRIRNNEVEFEDLEQLQKLYKPGFRPSPDNHYITLTTHNNKADEINARELRRLTAKEFVCEAQIDREFPDRNFPVEKTMRLKAGAQIMFVRNDPEEKKYFNGKIGVLVEINHDGDDEYIVVEFPETKEKIRVIKVTWRNIRYKFNEAENRIHEEELGSFTQYPIRLAWAVTIHKSQGLTFKQAVIDAGNAFAAGQVYVALSRCVSLEGIVLLSQIPRNVIMTDPAIVEFMNHQQSIEALLPILEREKEAYVVKKTLALFDMQPLIEKTKEFMLNMGEGKIEAKEKLFGGLHAVNDALIRLKDVAEKFREQVKKIVINGLSESSQALLNDRIIKAKAYFEKEFDENINEPLQKINKDLQKQNKVRKLLKEMKEFMDFFWGVTNRYRVERKESREENFPGTSFDSHRETVSSSLSENLFSLLKQIRFRLADEENVVPYLICRDVTLREMSAFLPQTLNELALINGMGDKTLSRYGEEFLSAIQQFCKMHSLASNINAKGEMNRLKKATKKKGARPAAGDTRQQSFLMLQSGKSIRQIADERKLSVGTIETHLLPFIKTGELDVLKVLSEEKFERIKSAMQNSNAPGLTALKNSLGDEVSFSEIRFAIAAIDNTR